MTKIFTTIEGKKVKIYYKNPSEMGRKLKKTVWEKQNISWETFEKKTGIKYPANYTDQEVEKLDDEYKVRWSYYTKGLVQCNYYIPIRYWNQEMWNFEAENLVSRWSEITPDVMRKRNLKKKNNR